MPFRIGRFINHRDQLLPILAEVFQHMIQLRLRHIELFVLPSRDYIHRNTTMQVMAMTVAHTVSPKKIKSMEQSFSSIKIRGNIRTKFFYNL